MKPGTPSEGSHSAQQLLDAIGPLHGSARPDVSLRPYLLTRHRFARIDTSFACEGGMAVSHPHAMPHGTHHPSHRS